MNRHRIVTDDDLRAYGDLHVIFGVVVGAILAALAIYVVVPIIVRTLT